MLYLCYRLFYRRYIVYIRARLKVVGLKLELKRNREHYLQSCRPVHTYGLFLTVGGTRIIYRNIYTERRLFTMEITTEMDLFFFQGIKECSRKKNILNFCVNRGDYLLCFYTNVTFENIGFYAIFRAFSFA